MSLVLILAGAGTYSWLSFRPPSTSSNTSLSGIYWGNQEWSNTITVTGDILLIGPLTISPGSTIRFLVQDDTSSGDEVPADGYNTLDPTRLKTYATTHSSITVIGKITAVGTPDQPITFTSAADSPNYADWEALYFSGNASRFTFIIQEYARNGINPIGSQPDSVIDRSIFRHNLWSGPSLSASGMTIMNSHISEAGHEGIDVQKGSATILDNIIEDCHTGIVILAGSSVVRNNIIRNCGDGIHVEPKATPILENNTITPSPEGMEKEWRYQNFSYRLNNEPTLDPKP